MIESLLDKNELTSSVKGTVIDGCIAECFFESVATDSRNVQKNSLFVPLMGEFQNGHTYIPAAIEKGASVVFVMKAEYEGKTSVYAELVKNNPSVLFILVENTLHALQNAAERYVEKFPELTKICVTGSCGKTTTKELLVSLFKAKYKDEVVYTKGNFNSETGLPLSVFNIRKNHRIGIFEMGMNRENEIGEISKVLKANYAVITNIGNAHIGILGSRENIAREKRKAFDYVKQDGAVFIPEDDDFAGFCTENVKGKIVLSGLNTQKYISFIKDDGLTGCDFSVDDVKMHLPLSGRYNFKNALLAIGVAKELGLTAGEIKTGIEGVAAVSGRMEICREKIPVCVSDGDKNDRDNGIQRKVENACSSDKNARSDSLELVLIKDFYNANPDSMNKAVEFCAGLDFNGRRFYVLADMKELGTASSESHRHLGMHVAELCNKENDFVWFIGPEMKSAFEGAGKLIKNAFWFENAEKETFRSAADKIRTFAKDGDIILIKGSHSMNLEAFACELTGKEV